MTRLNGALSDDYPYSAVVFLEVTYPSGSVFVGSGVMVGPNDVLTAAHLVYSDIEGVATRVMVSAGYDNGFAPFGTIEAAEWNYYDWDFNSDDLVTRAESEYDVAVVGLSTNLGDLTGWFAISTNYSSGYYNLTGYPSVYRGSGGAQQTNDYGYATEDPYNYVFNYVSIETNPGNSGGPLWFQDANGPHVVGIASSTQYAADITKTYDQIVQWITDNDDLIGLSAQAPLYVMQVGRLYEAGLGRGFDTPGLNFWIDQYEAGMPLKTIAQNFLDSLEFTTQFGDDDAMPNSTFVTRMYANVLDRAPDPAGFDFWLEAMNGGMSRDSVLTYFSDSTENVAQSAYLNNLHEVLHGYWTI